MAPDPSRGNSLGQPAGASTDAAGTAAQWLARAFTPAGTALEGLGRFMLLTLDTLRWLVRPPFRVGQLLNAMEFIGVQSLFIIMLTGTFSGMVFALQSVNSLREYGAEGVVGSVVAISLTREISPVFSALMVTARAGSAIAAELGNMRVTEQIDALTTMAVSPVQYLLSPRLLAGVLMFPLLCIVYSTVGMIGAWFVAVKGLGIDPGIFIANIEEYMLPSDFWMGEIKAACFGFLVTAICGEQGFYASGGARGVGQATTRAVVQSAVALLIANYIITSALTPI
ncbi:MAG TPA: ABC transporter permease [Polyangiaceae bacterium]|jgi:phospholipid/cholesterol/gamma-HCH transport system permease protein|nr:ABC transporter permease [Polyangiaceae bacterium]